NEGCDAGAPPACAVVLGRGRLVLRSAAARPSRAGARFRRGSSVFRNASDRAVEGVGALVHRIAPLRSPTPWAPRRRRCETRAVRGGIRAGVCGNALRARPLPRARTRSPGARTRSRTPPPPYGRLRRPYGDAVDARD